MHPIGCVTGMWTEFSFSGFIYHGKGDYERESGEGRISVGVGGKKQGDAKGE